MLLSNRTAAMRRVMKGQGIPVRPGGVYHKKKMRTMGVQVSAMIISLSSSPTPAADFLSLADLDLCLVNEVSFHSGSYSSASVSARSATTLTARFSLELPVPSAS
jgi:hypothetical protein